MTNEITLTQIDAAATHIRQQITQQPTIGLILGSGLSSLGDSLPHAESIPYQEIPHWPTSTVAGHSGRLVIGLLEGHTVMILQGRAHFYEGYTPQQITLPVRVMQRLGIKTVVVTNAAGGLNPSFKPGDLMLIKDHINLPGMGGYAPLRGRNHDELGPRFPDMTEPYSATLRQLTQDAAAAQQIPLHQGVYVCVAGPNYETPAELRYLQQIGGDAVGMSTAPEVVVARHAGMAVLGISTITNLALPDPAPGTALSHSEVVEMGNLVVPRLTTLLHTFLRQLPPD